MTIPTLQLVDDAAQLANVPRKSCLNADRALLNSGVIYVFNVASAAAHNGDTVVRPNDANVRLGRWLKVGAVTPAPSAPEYDGITPTSGGSLVTPEGTWTFGALASDGVNYFCMLNGLSNGWAVKMQLVNGNLYAYNVVAPGTWWLRQNGSWVAAASHP